MVLSLFFIFKQGSIYVRTLLKKKKKVFEKVHVGSNLVGPENIEEIRSRKSVGRKFCVYYYLRK